MKLRAVLFDLWGTLILDPDYRSRQRQEWRAGNVRRVLARFGVAMDAATVDANLFAAGAALSRLHDRGIDLNARGRVDLFLEQPDGVIGSGLPAEAYPALEEAITSMDESVAPLLNDGAVEVLRELKDVGLKTALISNTGLTTASALRRLLPSYGLTPLLDAFVYSDELELAKPDRRLFDKALDELGVEAKAAAFVGDSPHNDVAGAQAAGLFAVQIGDKSHDGVVPDGRIDTLGELRGALTRFEPRYRR
jgi:HAD superfamily hydrolase (TIGR01549 family)